MSDVTVLHNATCSTSRAALTQLADAGTEVEVVQYLKDPLDEAGLHDLIDRLEDEPSDLVRRDAFFTE